MNDYDKPLERWNAADNTLLGATMAFLCAVGLNIAFPDSIFTEGLLFVTEASMVGGIADWFAVTALFKKPLGFPFHTALLPNRRDDFINASVQMVQEEFFSRRIIFKKIGNVKLLPLIVQYLERSETRQFLLSEIFDAIKKYFMTLDKEKASKTLAIKLRREFGDIPIEEFVEKIGAVIKSGDKDTELFSALIKKLREQAAKPETREKLQEILETFANERTKSAGAFAALLSGLAQMLDFVNFEEAAEIMQTQLLKLLDELSIDSPIRRQTLAECREKFSELSKTQDFRDMAEYIQVDFVAELPIEKTIETALKNFEDQLTTLNSDEIFFNKKQYSSKDLGELIVSILCNIYEKFTSSLKMDGVIKSAAEKFVFELTTRAAFYSQPLVGLVTKNALGQMTVDRLNNLVYGKAESDFVWIRMNGSIVGSIVGFLIFILIQLLS